MESTRKAVSLQDRKDSIMNKQVLKQIKDLRPGALIRIDWNDASTGKSLMSGAAVDIPVKSWGIFVAILGKRNKHLVICHNYFEFSENLFDVDYTAVPLTWALKITVIAEHETSDEESTLLLKSFLAGRQRTLKRRVKNHEKLH